MYLTLTFHNIHLRIENPQKLIRHARPCRPPRACIDNELYLWLLAASSAIACRRSGRRSVQSIASCSNRIISSSTWTSLEMLASKNSAVHSSSTTVRTHCGRAKSSLRGSKFVGGLPNVASRRRPPERATR